VMTDDLFDEDLGVPSDPGASGPIESADAGNVGTISGNDAESGEGSARTGPDPGSGGVAGARASGLASGSGAEDGKRSLERAFEKAEFAPFGEKSRQAGHSNIDLLLDVPLPITVELGRTTMTIRDVLDLGPGSVVELDRAAGEPVDILVNGKLVAKGEVVVIDENFGVRVVDIVAPADRLSSSKS